MLTSDLAQARPFSSLPGSMPFLDEEDYLSRKVNETVSQTMFFWAPNMNAKTDIGLRLLVRPRLKPVLKTILTETGNWKQ